MFVLAVRRFLTIHRCCPLRAANQSFAKSLLDFGLAPEADMLQFIRQGSLRAALRGHDQLATPSRVPCIRVERQRDCEIDGLEGILGTRVRGVSVAGG